MTARRRPAPAGPPAPSGGRDEVLHVRVWRERRRDFALMTRVFVRDGARLIEKRALYPEGAAHIGAIAENAEWMRKTWRTVRLPARRPERESGPGSVVFDYVDGTPLDRLLSDAVSRGDREGLKGLLAEWLALLQLEPHGPEPLARTAFGAWPEFEDERWLRHGNLDPVPANLVRDPDGRHWALDPEWCLGGPVPAAYVLGRCWLNVRYLLGEPLLALIPEEEALGLLGLSRRDFETAQVLEAAFQSWVHGGDRTACLPASARRSQVTLSELLAERARDGEQIGRLRSELAAATSEAASLREQLAASEADREGRGRLLEAASAELASVREQLAASEADREGRGQLLSVASAELESVRGQLSVALSELTSVRDQLAASEAEREGRGHLLSVASAELESVRAQLAASEADREGRGRLLEVANSELASVRQQLTAAVGGLEQARSAAAVTAAELEARRDALQREGEARRSAEEARRRAADSAAGLGRALERALDELAAESARSTLAVEDLHSLRWELESARRDSEAARRRSEEALRDEARRREAVERELDGLRGAHEDLASASARAEAESARSRDAERQEWARRLQASEATCGAERSAGEELRRALAEARALHERASADLARIHRSRTWRAANAYWRVCRKLGLIR